MFNFESLTSYIARLFIQNKIKPRTAMWRHDKTYSDSIHAADSKDFESRTIIVGNGLEGVTHAQNVLVQHDTIVHTETVRDSVYQMRTVNKYVKPLAAQSSPATDQEAMDYYISENEAEQAACSMLCDNIPYALLATP